MEKSTSASGGPLYLWGGMIAGCCGILLASYILLTNSCSIVYGAISDTFTLTEATQLLLAIAVLGVYQIRLVGCLTGSSKRVRVTVTAAFIASVLLEAFYWQRLGDVGGIFYWLLVALMPLSYISERKSRGVLNTLVGLLLSFFLFVGTLGACQYGRMIYYYQEVHNSRFFDRVMYDSNYWRNANNSQYRESKNHSDDEGIYNPVEEGEAASTAYSFSWWFSGEKEPAGDSAEDGDAATSGNSISW